MHTNQEALAADLVRSLCSFLPATSKIARTCFIIVDKKLDTVIAEHSHHSSTRKIIRLESATKKAAERIINSGESYSKRSVMVNGHVLALSGLKSEKSLAILLVTAVFLGLPLEKAREISQGSGNSLFEKLWQVYEKLNQ